MNAVWLCFLGDKKNKTETFLYGLSIPTKCPKAYSLEPEQSSALFDDKRLFVYKATNEESFNFSDKIELKKYCKESNITPLRIVDKNHFIQSCESTKTFENIESPIDSLVNVETYYTEAALNYNFTEEQLIKILQEMDKYLNQGFWGNYASRIGCFDVVETNEWAETHKPFGINIDKEKKQFFFYREKSFKQGVYVVLKEFSSDSEKSYEKMIFINKNQKSYFFDFPIEKINSIDFSIYSKKGDLLDRDHISFITSIGFHHTVIGTSIPVKDEFSERDKKLSEISTCIRTSDQISIKKSNKEIQKINHFYSDVRKIVHSYEEDQGRWFKKSSHNLSDIIFYFQKKHFNPEKVVIIDPYADKDSFLFLIRIDAKQKIVISSTKSKLDKKTLEKNKNNIVKAMNMPYLKDTYHNNPEYYFIKKEFHDRFIIFEEGNNKTVYCLPNSINAMLKNDPFLIIRLSGDLRSEALNHYDELLRLCNKNTLLNWNNQNGK